MRISDWSSDVCSSDLHRLAAYLHQRLRQPVGKRSHALAKAGGEHHGGGGAAAHARVFSLSAGGGGALRSSAGHAWSNHVFTGASADWRRSPHSRRQERAYFCSDRKRVWTGNGVSGRVDIGGRGIFKKKNKHKNN